MTTLYERLKALFDGNWNTGKTTQPIIFNLKKKENVEGKYKLGIVEGLAPMPPVGLGASPAHERKYDYTIRVMTELDDAELDKMIEEVFRILDAATLTNGMYVSTNIGDKEDKHGYRSLNIFGYEHQIIIPGVAF